MVAVFWPRSSRRAGRRRSSAAPASSPRSCSRSSSTRRARHGAAIVADSIFRDRWAATRADHHRRLRRSSPCSISYGERMREEHVAEYYALLAAAGAGMAFFVQAANLMTLFLGLEWFSIALYILCAIDIDLVGSLEAGLKYLDRSAPSARRRCSSARRSSTARPASSSFDKIAAAGHTHDSLLVARPRDDDRRARFKASAAPFHMWTPDAYQGAPTPVTAFMSSATKVAALVVTYRVLVTAFPAEEHLWTWAIAGDRVRLARGRQHRRARAAEREAAARVLVGLARRLHADRDRRRQRDSARGRSSTT